jgi:ketosteroid isomerase-like protein
MKGLFLVVPLATLLCAFAVSQQQPSPLTDTQKAEIAKQVRQQAELKFRAVGSMNLEGMDQIVSSKEFLGYAADGNLTITLRQEFMDLLQRAWGSQKELRGEMLRLAVHPLAEDLALVDYTAKWQGTDKKGQVWKLNVSVAMLFRKEEAGWKAIYEHESTKEVK